MYWSSAPKEMTSLRPRGLETPPQPFHGQSVSKSLLVNYFGCKVVLFLVG